TSELPCQRSTAEAETPGFSGINKRSAGPHLLSLHASSAAPRADLDSVLPQEASDLPVNHLAHDGLYHILRTQGVTMRVAKQRIGARAASQREEELLDIAKGGPLLTMSRTAFDNSGKAIELARHL